MSITQHSQDARQARVRPRGLGKDRRVKFYRTVRQPRTRRRSPSTSNQATHAAPCLRPHTLRRACPRRIPSCPPRGPLPSGAQSCTACRSPISPHCTSRRQSRAAPPPLPRLAAHGQRPHAGMCATRECAWQLESRAARGPASARLQAMRSPPRRCRPRGRSGRPKVGRPRRHAFGVRHDCQGRADAASGGGPAGAGQVMRRRMRASAGAPCIPVRAMRQAGRAPRCPPCAVSGQARQRAGGRTYPRAIPHRILRAACPAGGPGRVDEASRPASYRASGAQMRPQNCAPLFQIWNV